MIPLDPQLRMLLDAEYNLDSRCCVEESLNSVLVTLCFWPGGEAASPDASHPGKPRNKPQAKVNFPLGFFPAFLGQKPSNFRKPQRDRRNLSALSNLFNRLLGCKG